MSKEPDISQTHITIPLEPLVSYLDAVMDLEHQTRAALDDVSDKISELMSHINVSNFTHVTELGTLPDNVIELRKRIDKDPSDLCFD